MGSKKHNIIGRLLVIAALSALAAAQVHALPPPRPGLVDPVTKRYRTTGEPVPVIPEAVRAYRRGRITSYNVCYTKLLREFR